MCGRFSLTATPQEVQELFGLEEIEDFPPRYNIAPTQPILIIAGDVRREEGDNRTDRRALLGALGFPAGLGQGSGGFSAADQCALGDGGGEGLVPCGYAAPADPRCRVGLLRMAPAAEGLEGEIGSLLDQAQQGGIVAFGGLMETYMSADGAEMDTAAVLTVGPNREVAPIHDRMPVVIAPEDFSAGSIASTRSRGMWPT
jgi:hypothetical protein